MVVLRGNVDFFDMRKGFGNLKVGETTYFFSKSSLQAQGKPNKGQEVEFKEDKSVELKEGQKSVAIDVAPLDGEEFNTERRRKKPTEGDAGRKGKGAGKLESRLDRIEGKLNEICEKLDIKRLGK